MKDTTKLLSLGGFDKRSENYNSHASHPNDLTRSQDLLHDKPDNKASHKDTKSSPPVTAGQIPSNQHQSVCSHVAGSLI